jgi:hypothetical protein
MRTVLYCISALLALLPATGVKAQLDIPLGASCYSLVVNSVTSRVYMLCRHPVSQSETLLAEFDATARALRSVALPIARLQSAGSSASTRSRIGST